MRVAYDAEIIKDIWGKDVTVKPVDFNSKANQGFEIVYSDVDLQTCSKLVSSLSNEFNEFKVNNKAVKKIEDIVNKDVQKCETVSFIYSY